MKSRSKVTAVLIAIALFATGTFLTGCKKGEQTDIVVIGGGGAGLSAAVTAAENGAKVVLVEKMPMLGGNTLRAQTGFNAAGTIYQADAGITDSPDIHYQDTMKGGKDKNDPDLVKTLTENAKDSLEWLNGLGAADQDAASWWSHQRQNPRSN